MPVSPCVQSEVRWLEARCATERYGVGMIVRILGRNGGSVSGYACGCLLVLE